MIGTAHKESGRQLNKLINPVGAKMETNLNHIEPHLGDQGKVLTLIISAIVICEGKSNMLRNQI